MWFSEGESRNGAGQHDPQILANDRETRPEALGRDVLHQSAHTPEIKKAEALEVEPGRPVRPVPGAAVAGPLQLDYLRRRLSTCSGLDRQQNLKLKRFAAKAGEEAG